MWVDVGVRPQVLPKASTRAERHISTPHPQVHKQAGFPTAPATSSVGRRGAVLGVGDVVLCRYPGLQVTCSCRRTYVRPSSREVRTHRGCRGRPWPFGDGRSTAHRAFRSAAAAGRGGRAAVLGGMLMSKDAIADVLEGSGVDFYRPGARERLRRDHRPLRPRRAGRHGHGRGRAGRAGPLRRIGGAPYLHTLISTVPTAANAGYYAGIVAEKAVLRRLVEAGTRIVQIGYAGAEGGEVDDIVDRAQAEVYEVTERPASRGLRPAGGPAAADDRRDRGDRHPRRVRTACRPDSPTSTS